MDLQEKAVARNKIENLLSRMVGLEARFSTLPGNVEEQRRRHELIRYAILPLQDLMLTSFQQTQGHRGAVEVVTRKAGAAAIC